MVGEGTLTNAVSLNSAAFTGARVIGPAIAGLVIAGAGMAWCFGLDAVSYLFVLGALVAMRPAEFHTQPRSTRERGHMVAGLKYVWATDELRRPLIVLAVMFTLVFNWQVLMPLLAEVSFNAGPQEFGLLSAAAGIGSLVGAVTTAHGQPASRDGPARCLLAASSAARWCWSRSRRRSVSRCSRWCRSATRRCAS